MSLLLSRLNMPDCRATNDDGLHRKSQDHHQQTHRIRAELSRKPAEQGPKRSGAGTRHDIDGRNAAHQGIGRDALPKRGGGDGPNDGAKPE